ERKASSQAVFIGTGYQEKNLQDMFKFLTTLVTLPFDTILAKKRFLKKAVKFFVQNGRMYKKMQDRPPLLVIFD
ncbi:hypothetical protein BDR04DRAFT_946700, partial [Suillus decipiens]